jgi:hypothetical protein
MTSYTASNHRCEPYEAFATVVTTSATTAVAWPANSGRERRGQDLWETGGAEGASVGTGGGRCEGVGF